MIEFLMQYWLEALFGAIIGALGFLCKKFYKLYQSEKQHQKTEEQKAFYKGIQDTIKEVGEQSMAGDKILQNQINVVTNGVLSIQGRAFKQECREVLKEDHEITLEEFEALQEEHNTYKSLGGNHDGDTLFEMVSKKATHNIIE